jgi:hypothetical protein
VRTVLQVLVDDVGTGVHGRGVEDGAPVRALVSFGGVSPPSQEQRFDGGRAVAQADIAVASANSASRRFLGDQEWCHEKEGEDGEDNGPVTVVAFLVAGVAPRCPDRHSRFMDLAWVSTVLGLAFSAASLYYTARADRRAERDRRWNTTSAARSPAPPPPRPVPGYAPAAARGGGAAGRNVPLETGGFALWAGWAGLVFTLATVVYMIPDYMVKQFGSVQDYAGAFQAGVIITGAHRDWFGGQRLDSRQHRSAGEWADHP